MVLVQVLDFSRAARVLWTFSAQFFPLAMHDTTIAS